MSLIIPANTLASGGYEVANSVRFNDGSSDYLIRNEVDPQVSNTKATFSFWVKRSNLSSNQDIYNHYNSTSEDFRIFFTSSDKFRFTNNVSGSSTHNFSTNQVFRDVSAWYNFIIAFDTTQSTESNRVKMWVNGIQTTSWSSSSYPSQNANLGLDGGNGYSDNIGRRGNNSNYFDGYLAEFVKINNTALDETSFGEFDSDSNIWKPIDVSGLTFGTKGAYLDFENSGALGNDAAGSNNFTVNNLTAIDQTTDTCTNNFATLNPLTNSEMTFSEGNTKTVRGGTNGQFATSTFEMNKGKWYFESKLLNYSGNSRPTIGLSQSHKSFASVLAGASNNRVYYLLESSTYQSNNATGITVNTSPATNDIYMWSIDLDNLKFYIGKNGTWYHSSNPSTGSNGLAIQVADYYSVSTGPNDDGSDTSRNNEWFFNFGNPAFAISSSNADGNGYGNFEYAVPSGFFSYNSKNLSEYG